MDNFNNYNQNQGYVPPVQPPIQQGQPAQNYQNYQQPNYQNPNGSLNYPQGGVQMNRPVPTTGWNWGAMMYGWVWGLANGTWMPLLGIIPVLNLFWWIVCGIKGNEWAMNSGMWRTVEEFNEGHIDGAVLIPEYEIRERAEKELPNKEQLILVYCRSGRRSKIAAQDLTDLGYTNVKEFGGIIDWQYEIVK
jgi:hypothetical protein